MKLINKSSRNYIAFDTVLEAGKVLDIQDTKTVNILKTQPEVEEYVDVEDIKKLKQENEKLKKETKKPTKTIPEDKKAKKA